jgi:hypothetical protein
MYEIEGWKVPEGEDEYSQLRDDLARRIREAVPSEQIRIMLRLVIANDCWPWNWYGPEQTPRTLYAACDALGIPHPEVIATQNDQVDEETDGDEEPDDEDVGA